MRLAALAVTVAGVLLASGVSPARAEGWEASVGKANRPSIVFISVTATRRANGLEDKLFGTGVLVHPGGTVLTCSHVVPVVGDDYSQVEIKGSVGGRYEPSYPMTVMIREENRDLVLLELPERAWPSVTRVAWSAAVGSRILATGFPLDLDFMQVAGSITGRGEGGRLLTDAAIHPGMSGGAVFNADGALQALVVAGRSGVDRIGYLIPISFAKPLLDSIGSPLVRPTDPQEASSEPDLTVTPEPDTVGIAPGALMAVNYRFKEHQGVSVQVESQDHQFFTLSGEPLDEPCIACRILGGSFNVLKGGEHVLTDNVLLPAAVAEAAEAKGASAVNLRSVFNYSFGGGKKRSVSAVLRIGILGRSVERASGTARSLLGARLGELFQYQYNHEGRTCPGYFFQGADGGWVELTPGDDGCLATEYHFQELRRDAANVVLSDASRGYLVSLPLAGGWASLATAPEGPWVRLHEVHRALVPPQ